MKPTDSTSRMEERLRTAPAVRPVSGSLHARIMDEVSRTAIEPVRRSVVPYGVALLVIGLALLMMARERPATPAESSAAAAFPIETPDPSVALAPLAPLLQPPEELLWREAEALKNDLASAGSHLLTCIGVGG